MITKRTKAVKAVLVVILFLCCTMVSFGIDWDPISDNYWDNPANWSDTGEGDPIRVPDSLDNVLLRNSDPDSGQLPCWVRPGTDAIGKEIWFSTFDWDSSSLVVDGNLTWEGNFIFTFAGQGPLVHDTAQINAGGVCSGGGVFVGNTNGDAEGTITLDGGFFDVVGGFSLHNSLLNIQINEGHFGFGGSSVGDPNDQILIININGIASNLVLPTDSLTDTLIPSGSLQAQGTTVTAANADSLLDIINQGNNVSLVVLDGADTGKARAPLPAEGVQVGFNPDLSWAKPIEPNTSTWTYEVYFDDNSGFTNVTTPIDVGPGVGIRGTVTNAQIGGTLSPGMYYWRVDAIDPNEVSGPTTHTGDVWSFAAASIPTLVSPENSVSIELDINQAVLEWSSGVIVDHSRVIVTPEGGSAIDLGTQTSPFDLYAFSVANPGIITMEWDTQYTWQVIEEDDGNTVIGVGDLWEFYIRALNCTGLSVYADIDGSGDCIVNLADFAVLANQWLSCGWDDGGLNSPCP